MDKRLCDKDELIAAFNTSEYGKPERAEEWTFPNKLAVQIVEDMPEVDAVEVVRCKYCKWYVEDREFPPFCDNPICGMQHPNDETFCSYGEFREDDETD
jgi:hypothetical protein